MSDVFISYIHEEELAALGVQGFVSEVLGESVKPFLSSDTSAIYAGERWMDRIVEELKGARVVIAILSPESVKRPWVNFEAGAAWVKEIAIIPACFNGLTKDTLPKPYSSLQGINLNSVDDQEYLVKSIAHYLALPPPPPRFPLFQNAEQREAINGPYKILRAILDNYS